MKGKVCIVVVVLCMLVVMGISTQQMHDNAGVTTDKGVDDAMVYVSTETALSRSGVLRFYSVFKSVDGDSLITICDRSLWLYMSSKQPTEPITISVVDTEVSTLIKIGDKVYDACRIYNIKPLSDSDIYTKVTE